MMISVIHITHSAFYTRLKKAHLFLKSFPLGSSWFLLDCLHGSWTFCKVNVNDHSCAVSDFLRGPKVEQLRLQGVEHVYHISAFEGKIYFRSYRLVNYNFMSFLQYGHLFGFKLEHENQFESFNVEVKGIIIDGSTAILPYLVPFLQCCCLCITFNKSFKFM